MNLFTAVAFLFFAITGCVNPRVSSEIEPRAFNDISYALRDTVQKILNKGISDSAFPAAYAVVGSSESIFASEGVGSISTDSTTYGSRVSDSTLWDLASLTKVLGTTSAIMQLVAQGKIDLDAPASRYIKRFVADQITVRQLLLHRSGLPAWRPLHKEAWSAEDALSLVYITQPDTLPGIRFLYSDLGFILLGEIVSQVSSLPLDSYLLSNVFIPLGLKETRFHPPAIWRSRIAPTEIDPWRQRHIHGEVHDENSYMLGAVSGHAGLFSSARELSIIAQEMLRTLGTDTSTKPLVFDRKTLKEFTSRESSPDSQRVLGWELATGKNSAGSLLSSLAFGHTGFTGTSIWIDPDRDLFVILLSNRVNPTRQRTGIGAVRTALADAAAGIFDHHNRP